jgi:hypothetical protein
MDKEKLKGWLDLQSDIYKNAKKHQDFDEGICSLAIIESGVQIRGALLICETLNIPFTMEDWSSEDAKAEQVTFEWNGVKFFSLENFRTESEVK